MTTRYATIIEGNEGEEIVSAIAQMEGAAPEPRSNAKVEKVADGVMIGMVRGGPVDSVGGFGFPKGSAGKEGRSPVTAKDGDPAKDRYGPEFPLTTIRDDVRYVCALPSLFT